MSLMAVTHKDSIHEVNQWHTGCVFTYSVALQLRITLTRCPLKIRRTVAAQIQANAHTFREH